MSISAAREPRSQRDTTDAFVDVFAALSEPLRVRMVEMMVENGDEDLPCTALDEALPIAKSTISYHVQILRRARIIDVRKSGRNYFYSLNRETLEDFAPALLEHLQSIAA